jgi:hypothetical protein
MRWWRAHQLVITVVYLVAGLVSWQIKEFFKTPGPLALFVVAGISAAIAGIVRGHLLFTEQMNRAYLDHERGRTQRLLVAADLCLAAALVADGLQLATVRALFGVLTAALGAGVALAALLMEPATTRAVFPE